MSAGADVEKVLNGRGIDRHRLSSNVLICTIFFMVSFVEVML